MIQQNGDHGFFPGPIYMGRIANLRILTTLLQPYSAFKNYEVRIMLLLRFAAEFRAPV